MRHETRFVKTNLLLTFNIENESDCETSGILRAVITLITQKNFETRHIKHC